MATLYLNHPSEPSADITSSALWINLSDKDLAVHLSFYSSEEIDEFAIKLVCAVAGAIEKWHAQQDADKKETKIVVGK